MGGDDHGNRPVAYPQPDAAQPSLDLVLVLSLPGVPDHEVQRARAEEELMADPVDLLPAEVPRTQDHVSVEFRVAERDRGDLDPVRGWPPFQEGGPFERGHQRGLADVALAHEQQLRLVERHRLAQRTQVSGQLGIPARDKFREGICERIAGQPQAHPVSQNIRQRPRQLRELIFIQVQLGEVGEVPDRVRQPSESVPVQEQLSEVDQIPDRVGKVGELISSQAQGAEVGEVTDPVRKVAELIDMQAQGPEVSEVADAVGEVGELIVFQA